jgi:hypothetical protein
MEQSNCVKIVEVYRTACGSVSQCNKTNSYILEYSGIATAFKASDFIDFIRRVTSIDLESLILSSSPISDVKVLMPPYCDRTFVLTLTDILDLRQLLTGAKFTLHLNSVLHECLQGLSFSA